MLQLREYQQRSLAALEEFLSQASLHGATTGFNLQTERNYWAPPQLPGLPYVCLRVPTGGGKTLMASHAVGIAARSFLQVQRAVCVWLVPSNTIRDQTLNALRGRQHPYRQALDAKFSGEVRVMDLTEALYVQRSSLEGETCIIVSTLAALRVEDTEGRKIYEECGALQHHFTGLPSDLQVKLEKREDGSAICSLANVLRLWRPLVIIDEAHNARTQLSFDTLARFQPSCIIEFTATPETRHEPDKGRFASNVLHHVSAAELKAEEMVKLPLRLSTREDWKEVIADALQKQRELEKAAREEERKTGEHIRPIVLLQAQPKYKDKKTLTVEVVKKALIEDFKAPEDQIAIATGQTREIDDIDLFDRDCSIRYIITVQALKEGWDCSFAYVLCSVADMSSTRAVEQILGRVLRLPRQRKKENKELNCAYVYAASQRFYDAARSLQDALIENGFQRLEAGQLVVGAAEEQGTLFGPDSLFQQTSETVTQAPNLSQLAPAVRDRVSYDANTGQFSVRGTVTQQEMSNLQECFAEPADREAVERIHHRSQGRAVPPKAEESERPPFRVPHLSIRVDGQLEMFEETHFLDRPWNLADCDSALSEAEFPLQHVSGEAGEVDVDERGRIEVRYVEQLQQQLSLLTLEPGWSAESLATWLDQQVPHPDIPQAQARLFILKLLNRLADERGVPVQQLAQQKFRLRRAVEAKIDTVRKQQSENAYQECLFGSGSELVEVSPEVCFQFDQDTYSPSWYYDGAYAFQKHYFRLIGELKSEGEEFECAQFLDAHDEVMVWARNLERRSESSFWLQTSTDRFYPDFVCMLSDNRILVVEAKGEHLWTNEDSVEKRMVGKLWADRSDGRCVFVMPKGSDWNAITAAIAE